MRYGSVWPQYAKWWDQMVVLPSRLHQFQAEAEYAINNKDTYIKVQEATGVPWYSVAVIHRREADGNFHAYLGNGEPLSHVTHLVPRGRGPFSSFQAGAVDALKVDGLSAVKDWTIEKILYYCELFNGIGYYLHSLPSPYVWGGTNIQRPGKYVADGVFNAHVIDTQPGCAPLLQQIAKLDISVQFVRET